MTLRKRQGVGPAARVAGVVTILLAVVYVVLVAVLDVVAASRLQSEVDQQIAARLHEPAHPTAGQANHSGLGIYGAPVFAWQVSTSGAVTDLSPGEPPLPAGGWQGREGARTIDMGGAPFRVAAVADGSGWLVAAESFAELSHLEGVLVGSEALGLPVLLATVFLMSMAIAVRAVAPVEQARRRQLEFTADASHELRTPLSVIEAELTLARQSPRDPEHDEVTLTRIAGESRRLTRIVEDLLWLARFDAQPPPPGDEPIDLGVIAEQCADRFAGVARERSLTLRVEPGSAEPVLIRAAPEWVDRLAGVLVDNACRYAGAGGSVRVLVGVAGGRAYLAVEDSGPGIPEEDRELLFDRFRRATDEPGGHGLGLAIADSVVRSSGGRWRIGDSPAGGARMEVSWPRQAGPRP